MHVIEPEPGAGSRPGVQYLNKLSAQFSARTAGKQLCLCFCTRLFDLLPHAYNFLLLQSMYWILHFTFSDHTLILDALRGFHLFISVVYNQSTNRKPFLIRAVTLVCRTVVSDIISYQVAWKLIFKHPLSARALPVFCSGWFNFTSICVVTFIYTAWACNQRTGIEKTRSSSCKIIKMKIARMAVDLQCFKMCLRHFVFSHVITAFSQGAPAQIFFICYILFELDLYLWKWKMFTIVWGVLITILNKIIISWIIFRMLKLFLSFIFY